MVSYRGHHTLEIGDVNGDVALLRLPVTTVDTATLADLAVVNAGFGTNLGAPGVITNGKVIGRSVSFTLDEAQLAGGTPAIDAEFPSVADKARLTFGNNKGTRMAMSIPAPIEGLFHTPPSDDTIDPSFAALATFIAWVEAHAQDVGGNFLNLYLEGVRAKSSARRRKQHRL